MGRGGAAVKVALRVGGGVARGQGPGQPPHSAPGQDEHQQNLLGGVGRGGESVRGEDRQRL